MERDPSRGRSVSQGMPLTLASFYLNCELKKGQTNRVCKICFQWLQFHVGLCDQYICIWTVVHIKYSSTAIAATPAASQQPTAATTYLWYGTTFGQHAAMVGGLLISTIWLAPMVYAEATHCDHPLGLKIMAILLAALNFFFQSICWHPFVNFFSPMLLCVLNRFLNTDIPSNLTWHILFIFYNWMNVCPYLLFVWRNQKLRPTKLVYPPSFFGNFD